MTSVRSPIHSNNLAAHTAEISTLRLDPRDVDATITAGLNGDTDEQLAEAIRRQCDTEYHRERVAAVPAPRWIEKPDERAAYQAAVHDQTSRRPGAPAPHVSDLLPSWWQRANDGSGAVAQQLPQLHDELKHVQSHLADQQQRHVLQREGVEPVEPLCHQRRWWKVGEATLWFAEAGGVFAAVGDHLGVFSGFAPASAWIATCTITALCVACTMALAFGCARLWRRLSHLRLAVAIAGVVIVVGTLLFAVGLGMLRSTQGEDAFTASEVTP